MLSLILGLKLGDNDGDKLPLGETESEILSDILGEILVDGDSEELMLGEKLGLIDVLGLSLGDMLIEGLSEEERLGLILGEIEGWSPLSLNSPSLNNSKLYKLSLLITQSKLLY